jgi:hypothetical protein
MAGGVTDFYFSNFVWASRFSLLHGGLDGRPADGFDVGFDGEADDDLLDGLIVAARRGDLGAEIGEVGDCRLLRCRCPEG